MQVLSNQGLHKKMYLALLCKCEREFDTDSRNGIHISYKKASINKGDFKEIVKDNK